MHSSRTNFVLALVWLGLAAWGISNYLTPSTVDDYLPTAAEFNVSEPGLASMQSFDSLKMPALAQYGEITERPLFYPERRPPKDEPPPTPTPEPVVEEEEREITLIGVLITPKSTTAMVKVEDEAETDLLKIGDKVESWQLAAVKPDSVLLKKGKETKELVLLRNQRKPSMTPRSLRTPPPAESESSEQTGMQPQPANPEGQQSASEPSQTEAQQDPATADERLRLRQERLKAIAERRRQLLEQQRARAAERDTLRRNNN